MHTTIVIDEDVQKILEFMQRNLQCSRLVPVAEAISKVAPILWAQHEREDISILSLQENVPAPTLDYDPPPQSDAKL